MEFVYLFKGRENFMTTMTEKEQAAIGQHLEYSKGLKADGKIILAGFCLDGAYGIVVFKADSPEIAHDIYQNDPVVQSRIMETELHPYQVSMLEGR